MELFENTFYINLKERTDRNQHVLGEFEKVGILNPQRINANKTKDGAIGCSMSHLKCLELAKKNNYEFVFICEDDITFTDVELFKKQLDKFMNSEYVCDWDVIVISGNNAPPFKPINDYLIRVHNVQAATGYIVRNHYYDKIINNFKEGLSLLVKNPTNKHMYACDMYWKNLQQNDIWYMIIPLTVVQYPNYSDIENKLVDYTHMMKDMSKEWIFRL
jgi:GR25 family glycosyltransferase involved in LPS biosynthesis